MYMLIRSCCLTLTNPMVPKSKERSTQRPRTSKSQIKNKKIHLGIKAVAVMHARPKAWSHGTGPYLAARRRQLTNQHLRLGRRTGCVPSRSWVRHVRTSRATCHDRCQGCTISFARHARRRQILLDVLSLPDATSVQEDQIGLAAAAPGC